MPEARDAGHVTKNFPRAIKVPINQSTGTATSYLLLLCTAALHYDSAPSTRCSALLHYRPSEGAQGVGPEQSQNPRAPPPGPLYPPFKIQIFI